MYCRPELRDLAFGCCSDRRCWRVGGGSASSKATDSWSLRETQVGQKSISPRLVWTQTNAPRLPDGELCCSLERKMRGENRGGVRMGRRTRCDHDNKPLNERNSGRSGRSGTFELLQGWNRWWGKKQRNSREMYKLQISALRIVFQRLEGRNGTKYKQKQRNRDQLFDNAACRFWSRPKSLFWQHLHRPFHGVWSNSMRKHFQVWNATAILDHTQ